MKRALWKVTGLVFFALAAIGSGTLGLWISDRTPPIEYDGASALAGTVPQGGTIEVEFKVVRARICAAIARRWLVDAEGERHAIPSYTAGLSPLPGRETYRRSITIPSAAAIGPATYVVDLDFSCNVIHRLGFPIRVSTPPIKFTITPNAGIVPFQESS